MNSKLNEAQLKALARNAVKTWYFMTRRIYAFVEESDLKALGDILPCIIPIGACKSAAINLEKIKTHSISVERELDQFSTELHTLCALCESNNQAIELLVSTEINEYGEPHWIPTADSLTSEIKTIYLKDACVALLKTTQRAKDARILSDSYERSLYIARKFSLLVADPSHMGSDHTKTSVLSHIPKAVTTVPKWKWIIPGSGIWHAFGNVMTSVEASRNK